MIRNEILRTRRGFFIEKVKAPLMKALITLSNRYPEPTLENVDIPNDKVWLGVWDRFFEMEDNPGRLPLFKAIKRVMIGEQHHDIYYRDRMQVLLELWLEEVLKGNWKPRSLDHPNEYWKVDPNKRGLGYEFMKGCYYYPSFRVNLRKLIEHPDKPVSQ